MHPPRRRLAARRDGRTRQRQRVAGGRRAAGHTRNGAFDRRAVGPCDRRRGAARLGGRRAARRPIGRARVQLRRRGRLRGADDPGPPRQPGRQLGVGRARLPGGAGAASEGARQEQPGERRADHAPGAAALQRGALRRSRCAVRAGRQTGAAIGGPHRAGAPAPLSRPERALSGQDRAGTGDAGPGRSGVHGAAAKRRAADPAGVGRWRKPARDRQPVPLHAAARQSRTADRSGAAARAGWLDRGTTLPGGGAARVGAVRRKQRRAALGHRPAALGRPGAADRNRPALSQRRCHGLLARLARPGAERSVEFRQRIQPGAAWVEASHRDLAAPRRAIGARRQGP